MDGRKEGAKHKREMSKREMRFQTLPSLFIGCGERCHTGAVNTSLTGVETWLLLGPPEEKQRALLELSGGCEVERGGVRRGRRERRGRLTER